MPSSSVRPQDSGILSAGSSRATIELSGEAGGFRTYRLRTTQVLRDQNPPDRQLVFSEKKGHAVARTGNLLFDGLYAMAVHESLQNSVSEIHDSAYNDGKPIPIEAYQTGEKWTYVWTRDLSYALVLGLSGFDPQRAVNSLRFKSSGLKASVQGGGPAQMIQDTGSGGSYPVSTDRISWALGAEETLKYLSGNERREFLEEVHGIFCATIEQDRHLVFDPEDGLYRGEHSFLDWREQTYPARTKQNVLPIAMSKALSVNAIAYFLLKKAAEYSLLLNQPELDKKYAAWARKLKAAINTHFFDSKAGLYRTYLFSEDGSFTLPSARYDLLGESLAILAGVADPERAREIIRSYPVGPFGPSVIWPQEKTVDIYHNQGIWPFVTAFWIKAARKAGNAAAIESGINSLYRQAALNLSNMENFDFRSGLPMAVDGTRQGPVINSRRQLWSVAAYLSMVQDGIFGLETSWDGIRFQPSITAGLRRDLFAGIDTIEWDLFVFRSTGHLVKIHLPVVDSKAEGLCVVGRMKLNAQPVADGFVNFEDLQMENIWEIFLEPPVKGDSGSVRLADVTRVSALFSPVQPEWAGKGIEVKEGKLVLHYSHPDVAGVAFNIYRDGKLCAAGVRGTKWVDPDSRDWKEVVRTYALEAFDPESGHVSHATPFLCYRDETHEKIIPASAMKNHGGKPPHEKYFKKWGRPAEVLQSESFQVERSGNYFVRSEFSNGSGSVFTGVTCAVKKIEVIGASSSDPVASGYVVMPQSDDWKRWDFSSVIKALLSAGETYTIRVSEDRYSRNMSYFKHNTPYTAHAGGGEESFNRVNIASVRLLYRSP